MCIERKLDICGFNSDTTNYRITIRLQPALSDSKKDEHIKSIEKVRSLTQQDNTVILYKLFLRYTLIVGAATNISSSTVSLTIG